VKASALDLGPKTAMKVPVTKHIRSKTRPFSRLGSLMAFGLALSVSAWGLQYKLSLYDPPQAAPHQVPPAKLLSKDQKAKVSDRRSVNDTSASRTAHAAMLLLFLRALSLLNVPASRLREQKVSSSWHLCRDVFFSALFVRPPPVLV
jgi:hypothetical protein